MRRVFLNLSARAAAGAATGLIAVGLSAPPALAAQDANEELAPGVWAGTVGTDAAAAMATTDDVTVVVETSGDHLAIHETRGLNEPPIGEASPEMFTPEVAVDGGWLSLTVSDQDCDEDTWCDRGTLAIGFSQPVEDPVIHLSGLGSLLGPNPAGTADLALAGSNPPGATVEEPAPGAVNLAVADGAITTTDPLTSPALCADGAGCGSIPVNGVVTALAFDVSMLNLLSTEPGDGISMLVSAPPYTPPEQPQPVSASAPTLPATGVPTLGVAGLGAAGILLGAALFGAARTRSRWRGLRRA